MDVPYCRYPECHNRHTNFYIKQGNTVYAGYSAIGVTSNSITPPIELFGRLCKTHAMLLTGMALI